MILEEAHTAATHAASVITREPLPASERQELQAEIAYLRTFSDVCRTHLRAYMESLSRSIKQWEQVERRGTAAAVEARESPPALSRASVTRQRTQPPFSIIPDLPNGGWFHQTRAPATSGGRAAARLASRLGIPPRT